MAHTDSTLLLGSHGSHRSHGIALWVGNLTDASVRELAHTDSAWFLGSHGSHFLGSHGSHRSHGVALWVGNLTDGSVGVGSLGLHGARSHGLIFWTLRTNQTYRTNRTDWTFLKIIREICGICVRPPWDWDLCEASVDSVGAGDKITKNCVIWGGVLKDLKKKCGKSCYIKKFLQTLCVNHKKVCRSAIFLAAFLTFNTKR